MSAAATTSGDGGSGESEGWFEFLCSSPSAAPLVLGLWLRVLGLVYAFACGMLLPQVGYLCGARGIQPAQSRLLRVREDFGRVKGVLRFPTLLQPFVPAPPATFDAAMRGVLWLGTLSGLAVAFGGLPLPAALGGGISSRLALGMAWASYLSMKNVVQLIQYPWDYLLLEAGFLSLFLPSLLPLTSGVALVTPPVPLVAFSLRWLLFRLMFGFGKMKFSGASTKEFSYLKGFMIQQPLPSILGWILASAPLVVHQLGLVAFFVSEIVVPFGLVFFSGPVRVACAIATIILQVHIHAAGNFGFFNLLSACLCLVCLDGHGSLLGDTTWEVIVANPGTHVVLGALLALSMVFLLFNSWATMSFMHWPSLNWPEGPTRFGAFLRAIQPFHIMHAYGIFFAHSSPGVRFVPVIEGTDADLDSMSDE